MANHCQGKDEVLLQLVHGQLSFLQAAVARFHVSRCPECRARLSRYTALSSALARTLASPAGPRFLPTGASRFAAGKGAVVCLALLALLISILVIKGTLASPYPPAPPDPTALAKTANKTPDMCGVPHAAKQIAK